ncbi:hypothetical protein PT974_12279 [Cladobotryum mycophilum]|uniref:Heterokaryon incompatibility domain-containing protein n=1 Tax=Cladobotryum mycophilum TaxID=491253 RepID=A0ABR0S7J5_9HYPO
MTTFLEPRVQARKLIEKGEKMGNTAASQKKSPGNPTPRRPRTVRRDSFGIDPLDYSDDSADFKTRAAPETGLVPPAPLVSADQPTLKYQPLSGSRSIRLLKFLSLSRQAITCSLEHWSIDDAPPYDALSYTWQEALYENNLSQSLKSFYGALLCDGTAYPATRNLLDALHVLSKTKACTYLWVDAVCIDQTNLEEKASQILMMGDIYARAARVIVWLGLDINIFYPKDSAVAIFADMQQKVDALRQFEAEHGAGSLAAHNPLDPAFHRMLGVGSPEEWRMSWVRYFSFFQRRRWFRRAWVVQEVALASSEITLLCGEAKLPWRGLYEMGILLRDNGWRHILADSLPKNTRGGIGDEVDRMVEYQEQVRHGGPKDPLLQDFLHRLTGAKTQEQLWVSYLQYMVQEMRRFSASDDRDKIYAALALTKRFKPPGMKNPIQPDYTLSTNDVYVAATRLFLEGLPYLSALSYVEDSGRRSINNPPLPSWIPDYTVALGRVPFIQLGRGMSLTHLECHYTHQPSLFTSPAQDSYRLDSEVLNSTLSQRVEALWRTLIADMTEQTPKLHPAPAKYGEHFRDWIMIQIVVFLSQSSAQFSKRNHLFPILQDLCSHERTSNKVECLSLPSEKDILDGIGKETIEKLSGDSGSSKEIPTSFGDLPCPQAAKGFRIFDQAVREVMADRCVFTTREGYLGLGPASLREGDEVWLLQGARVPFALSPDHRLRGEVYLHGWMHGEMLETELADNIGEVIIN